MRNPPAGCALCLEETQSARRAPDTIPRWGYPPGVAPEVAPELVAAALGERYGLALAGLEPTARGWMSETYTATTVDGARFFVKVFPSSRLPRTAAPALPALAEPPRRGTREVPWIVPGRGGALGPWIVTSCEGASRMVVTGLSLVA